MNFKWYFDVPVFVGKRENFNSYIFCNTIWLTVKWCFLQRPEQTSTYSRKGAIYRPKEWWEEDYLREPLCLLQLLTDYGEGLLETWLKIAVSSNAHLSTGDDSQKLHPQRSLLGLQEARPVEWSLFPTPCYWWCNLGTLWVLWISGTSWDGWGFLTS